MDRAIDEQLTVIRNEVQASAIPDDCKQTALWCIGQLPTLYSQFCLTNESRYGDEISRLVQGVLRELAKSKDDPEAQKRTMSIPDRLQRLHEKFGIPRLTIKAAVVPSPRSRKAGAVR
jgi:hypothetical protein